MADETIVNRRTTTLTITNGLTGERGVIVGPTGSVVVDGNAVVGTGGGITVTVAGLVQGRGATGVLLQGTTADLSNAVYVAEDGRVLGRTGIVLDTFGSSVLNEGLIRGTSTGIRLGGQDDVEVSKIVNTGTIEARTAIRVAADTTEGVSIDNGAGAVIRSTVRNGTAIDADATAGLGLRLENAGLIGGAVRMGGTNDVYVNDGGRVTGRVFGEGGRDTFTPGGSRERIDGGAGIDTLDFSAADRVTVTLGGRAASNTGAAKGDTYTGIERVLGSEYGRDDLRGSNASNTLDGQGGNDRIAGGRGNDALVGGAGRDVLTGGPGNDTFVFNALSERGDRITDFGSASGNIDRFRIDGDAFGSGLVDGSLSATQFDRGRDNVAGDVDDRFIFRTTDRTLWFDTDGLGGAGPVLIADLQARANVTADDILIF